jgi:response regulator RpfG family c-di-GMP phosphodiesterase
MNDDNQTVKSPIPEPTVKKGNLMIAEDDALLLKIFERFFAKHYNLITAKSGNEALELIKRGSKPEVILSDQRMPGLSGDEFLAETIKYLPDSVRVIVTAHSDPKEIISAINRAHTYMFLTKPIEEIELVQAVRLCFTHYYTTIKNKALMKEIQDKNVEIQKVMSSQADSQASQVPVIKQLSFEKNIVEMNKFYTVINNFYYKNFFDTCIPILRAMATSLKLPNPVLERIYYSLHLYAYILNFMPAKFIVNDPEDLTEEERKIYFTYYRSLVDKLYSYDGMNNYALILNQIWENNDGTGMPNQLTENKIIIDAQIIKIVLMYVNHVFRIPNDIYNKKQTLPVFNQPLAITTHRHRAITKYLYDRAKWFESDIFNHLRFMLQDNANEAFLFDRKDLTIPNYDYDVNFQMIQHQDLDENDSKNSEKAKSKEQTIRINELQEGMMVGQNVHTKSGILVARQETILNIQLIKNIQRLDSTGQLSLNGIIDIITYE